MVDLFFYRDPEEVIKAEEVAALAGDSVAAEFSRTAYEEIPPYSSYSGEAIPAAGLVDFGAGEAVGSWAAEGNWEASVAPRDLDWAAAEGVAPGRMGLGQPDSGYSSHAYR
ncbi:uncharacterized protein Gasu_64400 [Galdieria sulphuraria]|uniref:Small ribosomal subunit protein uS2 C-terminal domain-containing protein n=1 Tax=Galdieria sulphuraria TaxID=130081 RepID=M2X7U6_GALSU|nr:uncharacterized protein Gasu_64400 [Galdieria sulphuraria]EME25897.1 hypothetical protein Gasu_64400 [Galdieria sulphuraria]|eukprot:XP_005702417.1 hypothetical protein Gasu_64400 [Galdieria sulphuraria]